MGCFELRLDEPLHLSLGTKVGIMSQGRGGALRPGFRKARKKLRSSATLCGWLDIIA